tara:strand:+ start:1123 stop:1572 length:450 start_codon:yes stop_codon:yes gene_type:complete
MPIKSFRGLIADGGIDSVPLHTNTGTTGYRIKKLEVMSEKPFFGDISEHCIKIYTIPQTAVDGEVDFSDQTLLAVAISTNHTSGWLGPPTPVIIFDNMTFNQDIYITCNDAQGSQAANYYVELEQVKLSLDQNTVATLKDIRNQNPTNL